MKRVKSFFITAISVVGTAFFAIVLTPEWGAFLQFAHDKIASWGIPAVILALFGVFLSEVWKAILNARTIAKRAGIGGSSKTFADYENELY